MPIGGRDTTDVSAPGRTRGRIDLAIAVAVAAVAVSALLATSRDYAMVWDEGHTVRRERVLADWFARLAQTRDLARMFSARELSRSWPFSREEPDGHPPFYALLGLAGWSVGRGWLDPLSAYRLGPIALSAITLGGLSWHFGQTRGRIAGLVACATLLAMPRAFAHAHYAHYDMPMSCLWLLAQVAFVRSLRSRGWAVAFGVASGLAAGTKFTGWFAPVGPIAWSLVNDGPGLVRGWLSHEVSPSPVRPDRVRGLPSLAIGLPVAGLVLFAIQPPWWIDPIGGPVGFFRSNLTRSLTKPIPSLYLGVVYPFCLPWHNTLVITGATVPVFTLVLAVAGIVAAIARGRIDPEGMVWVLSWATLMVVRALPSAPGHDVDRLILPSLLCLAPLASLGASALMRRGVTWGRPLAIALAACAVGEGTWAIARLYPFTLSYYNFAVGGLKGAEDRGFELTYYWDTLGRDFFAWAGDRARDSPEPLELRFPAPLVNVGYLRAWGRLPRDVRVVGFDPAGRPYYVLQRRKGVYYPYDWWLDRHGTPAFALRREGVDLLRVYSFEESFRAFHETTDEPIPDHLRN